jgi:VWFA-related protein
VPRAPVVGVAAALLAVSVTSAQFPPRPPQAPQPVFRARTDLIQVDVTVLDRDRRPVHGLTAKDFTVFEDGKPQPISAVIEMTASDPDAPADSWMRTVVPDVKVNNAEDGRVLLLVLDDARTPARAVPARNGQPAGPNPKDAVKEAAKAIVERLGPADLASVIFTLKNKHEQEFTNDRNRLFAAIEGFDPVASDRDGFNEARALDTYQAAAKLLGDIPNRRKAVILISAAAPAVLPLEVDPTRVMGPSGSPGSRRSEGQEQDAMKLKAEFIKQEALQWALHGNVTFYNINPTRMADLDVESAKLLEPGAADGRPAASFGAPTSGPPPPPRYYDSQTVPRYQLDQVTGGFSIRRAEDFAAGVTQIFRETGSYYLIGYTNPERKDDGKLRRVEVRVNRPDLVARSRAGYFAPKKSDQTKYVSPMWEAISGLLPAKDIAMRINATTFAIPGKKEAGVAIAVGLREPVAPDGKPVPEVVDVLTQAFTTNGDKRGLAQHTRAELTLLPNPRGESKYEVLTLLKLKPGRYHLRVSATSRMQARSGSIYHDLDIPDFAKAALSLSSVALTSTPALVIGPKEAVSSLLPLLPTTQREFQGHRADAYFRIYQGGKSAIAPVDLTTRIVDTADRVVLMTTEVIDSDRFDKHRAAEHRFEVPTTTLPPGAYLLTFEAQIPGAAPVRQDLRFVVAAR